MQKKTQETNAQSEPLNPKKKEIDERAFKGRLKNLPV